MTGDTVLATINYVRNPVAPGEPALTFVTEDPDRSTMATLPGCEVRIENLRGQRTSLDVEGFELVEHVSSVGDWHSIEEDPATCDLYIEEMTTLLKDITGARTVIMQDGGKKRYGLSATDRLAGLTNALPALYPHGDTTDESALRLSQMILDHVPGIDLESCSRWAHYNIWRPITPPPQDYPLALCDARTISPADREVVVAHTETRTAGTFVFETTGYLRNPGHRWCYFRDMTPDEVLVFVTHDSDPARPHQVAHSASLDPTCPSGVQTRGSVEMRALALFA